MAHDAVKARQDDRARAFADLTDRHLDDSYRLAAVLLRDPTEVEDATHDAVVVAWRKYRDLRDPDRFRAWFTRILVNVCRDRMRSRRRLPGPLEVDLAAGSPDQYRRVDERDAVGRAFVALGVDHRIALVLRYYGDLSVDEIAERVGVPAGTVKSRIHKGLRQLEVALRREAPRTETMG